MKLHDKPLSDEQICAETTIGHRIDINNSLFGFRKIATFYSFILAHMSEPSERREQEDSISRSSKTTIFRDLSQVDCKETRNKSLKHPEITSQMMLLKTLFSFHKYINNNLIQTLLEFAILQENSEDGLIVAFSWTWYNG